MASASVSPSVMASGTDWAAIAGALARLNRAVAPRVPTATSRPSRTDFLKPFALPGANRGAHFAGSILCPGVCLLCVHDGSPRVGFGAASCRPLESQSPRPGCRNLRDSDAAMCETFTCCGHLSLALHETAAHTVTCNFFQGKIMTANAASRVQKHRAGLRASGMRPVQIWVPDTRRPDFADECRRQARLASAADRADAELPGFIDAALSDVDGWST